MGACTGRCGMVTREDLPHSPARCALRASAAAATSSSSVSATAAGTTTGAATAATAAAAGATPFPPASTATAAPASSAGGRERVAFTQASALDSSGFFFASPCAATLRAGP